MDLANWLPYLTNGGVALLVVALILAGALVPGWMYREKVKECDEWKRAARSERSRGDVAVEAGIRTTDALMSLRRNLRDVEDDDDLGA